MSQYACSGDPYLSIGVQAGVTYYVMIASADNNDLLPLAQSTPLHIRFDHPPVPNDLIQDATVVNSFPFSVEQNIYGSTLSSDDPEGCTTNFQSNSVWFQYTPAQNQGVVLDTTTSDYKAAVKVYTLGAGNKLVEQGCAYGSLGLQIQAGVPYVIMIARLQPPGAPPLLPTDKLRFSISAPVVANDLLENAAFMPIVQFQASGDASLALTLDNVSLKASTTTVGATQCQVEPPVGANLVQGGDFTAGLGSWAAFNAHLQSLSVGGNNMMQIARDDG